MGNLLNKKLIGLIIVIMLTVSSNFAMGNLASSTQNNYRSNSPSSSSNSQNGISDAHGFGSSWSINDVDSLVHIDGSVELVIGVGNKPNSYGGLSGIISKNGGEITDDISMGSNKAVVINVPAEKASAFAGEIRASGFSKYIEPNKVYQVDMVPNDYYWNLQYGPQITGADYAWNTTIGSSSVLVAVVDTGIDYNHPDLAVNYVALGYDWVNNDNNPMDDHGHGTHCAGVIAAIMNNGIGIAGLAQVHVMAEKGLNATGYGDEDDLANCIIDAVDKGAQIISNSWGSDEASSLIHDAIIYAVSHGVLVVAAAGNTGTNEPQYPGAFDEVVCVGATDSNDDIADFSTYGSWVDVSAPGVMIASTYPNNSYAYMSGTSMACPHVAGVAALILSKSPSMTADLVRYQLETTSDDLGASGHNIYFGYGRINAQNAVEQTPPQHDLVAYDWQTYSQYLKLGSASAFNLTVFNRGLINETNVHVNLVANNTVVNSTIISVTSGNYTSKLLSWTPATKGTYNITFSIAPVTGETETDNNQLSQNVNVVVPANDAAWTLLATDPDEGYGNNLKAGYSQLQSDIIYFKVDFYHAWVTVEDDVDAAIMIDVDKNASTGLSDGYYTGQNDYIGADYMIIVGYEGPTMWAWNATEGLFDQENSLPVAYLDAPDHSSSFVVGVYLTDLHTDGNFDFVFCDAYSNWDWMPDSGYLPFIPRVNQHEIAVTLETGQRMQPGQTAIITATVYNFGQNTESDVHVTLFINGMVVNNTVFTSIASSSFHQVFYSWTPTVSDHYNITAYAIPVTNENIAANNLASKFVPVVQKIALISESNELSGITPILRSLSINYDAYTNNSIRFYTVNQTLLQQYSTIIFYKEDRAINATEESTLNAYLASGGNLIVTGYDSLGDPDDPLLANVVRSATVGDDYDQPDLIIVNATHPIMNGPYGQFVNGTHLYNLNDDNDLARADTARSAIAVARLADGYDKIIVTQGLPGKVVYWNGDGVDDWVYNVNCTKMFKNMLVWLVDTAAPATTVDYNGAWHVFDFNIVLSASDYFGVNQTYYKVNGGATKTLSVDGQPIINVEAAANTLEYWSVDCIGNQEVHHTLTQIGLDKTSPTGSISINGGANYTNSTSVTLTVTATDAISGVYQVRFSNNGLWDTEAWETAAATKAWTLTLTEGTKAVYCQIKDNAGLVSSYSNSIILDTTAPTALIALIKSGESANRVVFYGDTSADSSGIVSYLWDFGDGTQGSGATATHTYSSTGTFSAKLTVQDSAGNMASSTANVIIQPQPTPTPTPSASSTPASTTTPTPSPFSTPTPNLTSIQATILADETTIDLSISGNITASQISSATISVNQSLGKTTLSFTITGQSGTIGFGNVTIPKSSVPYGTTPTIYIDNQICEDQGFTEDAANYYVWYTTHFSTHQVSIVFLGGAPQEFPMTTILVAITAIIVVVIVAALVFRNREKTKAKSATNAVAAL